MKNRKIPFTIALLALSFFALLSKSKAVNPPPSGERAGGNTAEGQNALLSLTSGTFNTAVGFFSLRALTDGDFNTATGAGTLFANTADENTAILATRSVVTTRELERLPSSATPLAGKTQP